LGAIIHVHGTNPNLKLDHALQASKIQGFINSKNLSKCSLRPQPLPRHHPHKMLSIGTEGSFQNKELEKLLITLLITKEKVNKN
jgi:hypothetical protein